MRLFRSIPRSWKSMMIELHAPRDLLDLDQVERDAGFVINATGHDLLEATKLHALGIKRKKTAERRAITTLIADHKLPGFLNIFTDGRSATPDVLNGELARKITLAYLKRGYGGRITVSLKSPARSSGKDASCMMLFGDRSTMPQHLVDYLPEDFAYFEWDPDRHDQSIIAPLLAACKRLKLKRFKRYWTG